MTDVPRKTDPSTALVPFVQAQMPAKVVPPDMRELQESWYKAAVSDVRFFDYFALGGMGVCGALYAMPQPAHLTSMEHLAGQLFFGIVSAAFCGRAYFSRFCLDSAFAKDHKAAQEQAAKDFIGMQKTAYSAFQKEMIRAADEYLEKGGVLNAKDVSWLAAMPQHLLQEASDKLAISVLQARKLLAWSRNEKGEISRPLTFAALYYDPEFPQLQKDLRARLAQDDVVIAEQAEPEYVQAVITPANFKAPFWQNIVRLIPLPLSTFADVKRTKNTGLGVSFPEVHMPLPKCAEDFEAALAAFEADHDPLDLPAMRGWEPRKHKALPGLRPRIS